MNPGERPIGDDDLQALIDGRLGADRREAVDGYLAAHPAAADQVATDIAARDALRARLAGKAQQPIPSRLRVANILAERRRRGVRRFAAVAAASAWLLVGAGAGWLANTLVQRTSAGVASRPATVTADAITAYRTFVGESLHPVEVRADQEAHLVQWLSRRLGNPVSAPDLSGLGFRLLGGRLLPAGAEPAAMFMYDDDRGTRLTLYARPGGGDSSTPLHFDAEAGVSAFSWTGPKLAYVVAARTDRARLLAVAESIDRQVRPDAPGREGRL